MADPTRPAPAGLSKGRIFLRRLVSSLLLWTIVISALFSGHKLLSDDVFLVLMMALAGLGLAEFYGMMEKRGLACFKALGVAGGVALMAGTFFHATGRLGLYGTPSRINDFETTFLILFVLGLCLRHFFSRTGAPGLVAVSTTLFGLMYVPWLLNFIQKINFFPFPAGAHVETGHFYVLYFLLVTKFSDMGAYCVGSVIGRHKMIPRISPGKTWEGFGGAIAVSVGASLAFAHLAGPRLYGMTPVHAVILGVVLSVSAVIGDLIESIFKREAELKDSGNFFPGIGGILDLLDSLLFNAPIMYLYVRHVLTHD